MITFFRFMEKKAFVQGALVVFLSLIAVSGFSQTTNTANFSADCRSVQLNTITYVDAFANLISYYFTTFDGTTNYPSHIDYTTNGDAIVSGELAPITNGTGQFRTSYILTSTGQAQELNYGTYTFTLSTNSPTDTNGNGLFDLVELSQAATNSFTVAVNPILQNTNFAPIVSATFMRASNAFDGTFSVTTSNTIVSSNVIGGTFHLLSMAGTISYTRGVTNAMSLSLTNSTNSFTVNTSFVVSNANLIVLPAFWVVSADGFSNFVAAGTAFKRTNNNTYIANVNFVDGNTATSFTDYTNWVFQFTDYNDSNSNSIPDFSDAYLPPFFDGAAVLGLNIYYLAFPDGVPFGYYSLYNFPYFYHYDLGYEYYIDAGTTDHGAYFYDYASHDFLYTSPAVWPFVYDFTLNSWLYYYPNTAVQGRYSSNPRYFYNFGTGQIITR